MNPFYFNDTAAYLIDDTFTKEEVEAKGYMRRDEPIAVDIPANVEKLFLRMSLVTMKGMMMKEIGLLIHQ